MLVAAMWTLLILGVFSLSLGLGVRSKASLLNRLSALDALYPIAYSGVEEARSLVRSDTDSDVDSLFDPWTASQNTKQSSVAGGAYLLMSDPKSAVVDEERKINLNKTSPEIAVRILQKTSGLSKDKAEELAYNLIDWMDSDSFFGHAQYGAEDSYYEGQDLSYSAKDAPFEVIDELLLVKDMTTDIFERIKPYVTIYGTGRVNLNTASLEVLEALGFNPQTCGLIVQARSASPFTDAGQALTQTETRTGAQIDASQKVVLDGLMAAERVGVSSTFFSSHSRGIYEKTAAEIDVEAVFDRKGRVVYQRVFPPSYTAHKGS